MINICENVCKQLESNDRRQKIEALEALQLVCDSPVTSAEVLTTFDECYLHVLKCYSDRYESVRNQACRTVDFYIEKLPPNDFHLLNIISTLSERMGKPETVEESEEIRLVYVSQLGFLLQYYAKNEKTRAIVECYPDIVKILSKALRDSFPAVQRKACECIVQLSKSAETYFFQQCAEQLIKPLYAMLNHKHSQSRISAVQALARLALHVNANTEVLAQLFMEVSPLLMDSMPLVRRECGQMGVLMALELKDRYSYFDRIIPLVLCCLKDESPDVRNQIYPLWVKCGQQFYEENETELNKQELVDMQVENYPIGVRRPTIGCRALVQRSLRLLKLITRESTNWKENVRLHSLKLLYQFVLHAEAAMTAKFFEIFPDVARACCDSEPMVVREAIKVADLMGRLFNYDDWCEHGFDGLLKNIKCGYLKCFYYMFTAAKGTKFGDVMRVSQFLIEPAFSQTLKPEFQLYVVKLVQTLLERLKYFVEHQESIKEIQLKDNEKDLFKNLYVAVIKVMALSLDQDHTDSVIIEQKGNNVLETIAKFKGVKITELHEEYFDNALGYVENLDAPLDSLSEPILLLHGLITISKFRSSYMESLQRVLSEIWKNSADDAKVKIFSTISISMLSWNETIALEIPESTELLLKFTESVVKDHLIWKAGANAEAMRSLATASLSAMAQGAKVEARNVLPTLANLMPSLIEDQSISTRIYALKCLNNFGDVKVEELKPIAYATLQRLDDPSATIRELAASVIPKLTPKYGEDRDETLHEQEIWRAFICKALQLLFLHFEGPEVRLKTAIKGSLLQLAKEHPTDFMEYFARANAMAIDNSCLTDLRKELPSDI